MTYSIFNNNPDLVIHHLQKMQTAVTSDEQLIPTISYWSLQKSISNLQALTRFYFPLQGLSETDLPLYMPLLIFVEATIYQIDEEYENHIYAPQFISKHTLVLRKVLSQLNLFDENIENELKEGLTYYKLEQKFCCGEMITKTDIERASLYKCFDFGILQRLLFKLTAQPYDEELLRLCRLSDQICKIWADLQDYQKDINRNVINTYRMFVRFYSADAPQCLHRYMEELNSQLQAQLKLLEKTKPETFQNFIELWKADLKLMKMWNAQTEEFVVPEIPEPMLEDSTTVSK